MCAASRILHSGFMTSSVKDRVERDLGRDGAAAISISLQELLADLFTLDVKTKNFHWHMSGRDF